MSEEKSNHGGMVRNEILVDTRHDQKRKAQTTYHNECQLSGDVLKASNGLESSSTAERNSQVSIVRAEENSSVLNIITDNVWNNTRNDLKEIEG